VSQSKKNMIENIYSVISSRWLC